MRARSLHERVAARYRLLLAMSMDEAKAVLGFPPSASPSPSEVSRAYKQKAFENHPDRGGDPDKMVEINVAKDILEGKGSPSRGEGGGRYQGPEPPSWYEPPKRPKPEPQRVSWEEAEAAAGGVPSATWKFKTDTAYGGHGDSGSSGFVVVGELGPERWIFVAVEHYYSRNAFTGEDIDEWWMKQQTYSGALRDVAPKAIRQMFEFPHITKHFNAKVEILPEGTVFNQKLAHLHLRTVSFKDAMEILGQLGEDDPWKARKLQIAMVLNSKGLGASEEKSIELIVNGREFKLRPESVELIDKKTNILRVVFGTYFYWHGDKKMLTRAKSGKKVMELLAEKLTWEPQQLRDALAAAAAQMT